jgi:phage terminase small subunit
MAVRHKGGRSFADERRLIAIAQSMKSLEAIASELGRTPESVAKSAKRLGVSLKSEAGLKVKK